MKKRICYYLISDAGKKRKINQDNFICDNYFSNDEPNEMRTRRCGTVLNEGTVLFGIFDGLGGEEKGEEASYIAAKEASSFVFSDNLEADLQRYCSTTNEKICKYAEDNNIASMGTTMAVICFRGKKSFLCNVGDSKIYVIRNKKIKQISHDHIYEFYNRKKQPLTQCLGMPESEIIIEPYIKKIRSRSKDIYLICSDGLSDRVTQEEICNIIITKGIEDGGDELLSLALEKGGQDNISIIICKRV